MENFITLDESKLIFVSFEPGCGGHSIARTICSLPNVYWYSHPDNGINPWNTSSAKTSNIWQRRVAPRHFDRLVNGVRIPPTWDYVKDYIPDCEWYLRAIFYPAIEKAQRQTSKMLVFPTHLTPFELRQYFGSSACLNVLYDPLKASKRHILTTSKFPAYVKFPDFVPKDNEYLKWMEAIHIRKPNFTTSDIWAFKKYDEPYNESKHFEEYENELLDYMNKQLAIRKQWTDKTVYNIEQGKINWKGVKDYIG